ncbi:MAG: class I SAM-dependent DNA methyltransferase [Clostridia bacterium]|nr:class I SAM-dependent DNA methyltransferase [Clostridia bacterium]
MDNVQQRNAVKQFVKDWTGRGDEKQDAQNFWRQLLQKVFGVEDPEKAMSFEYKVKNDQTGTTIFIDGYIHATSVLIEQKSLDIDLKKGYKQSDGSLLSPFQQARRYAGLLPHNMNPRWIVVSNFQEFHIHNMNQPNAEPEIVKLADLEKEYHRLGFLVDTGNENLKKEMEISIKAGELVGRLYDAFYKQYKDPESERAQKSLNALCVRLVFCLYAEDAGIFGRRLMFHDYMKHRGQKNARRALIDLFKVLDQAEDDRDPYLKEDDPELAAFPYVNGGLFSDENIEIPALNEEIFDLLLAKASEDFDWSEISPTIFGAVFESTLNPETRRKGGMHYTSIENIHKVIDPLFLDALKAEFEGIKAIGVDHTRKQQLNAFQDKLASLTFLDPAAGSGNFLTETYLCLRRLENEVISELSGGQIMLGLVHNPIKVSITQFYGIEINDFAVTVAKTALWIAESQMMKETEDIVHMTLDFLPLTTNATVIEGNALRLDWNEIVPKEKLNYIMGNPPFVGGMYMSPDQKADITEVMTGFKAVGELDYVAGWYKKASELMKGTMIRAAFVSTNSICQGQQATTLWGNFLNSGLVINFAHQTFIWDSEASIKAHVHCIIVGFSYHKTERSFLFDSRGQKKVVSNINQYLTDGPSALIESRSTPLCDVPPIRFGSMPRDGGGFILSEEERDELLKKEPLAEKWVRLYLGAEEFLKNKKRYCLWLLGANPADIAKCPTVKERIEKVRAVRLASKAAGTRKFADTPTLFCQIAQPTEGSYIAVPKTSSERRKYIPLGFLNSDVIASDLLFLIPDASLYHLGVLESNVHMAWMRTVCGRLKSDYRYSKDIVYNNFPWPYPTEAQRSKIEKTARGILDARKLYLEASLANLYDEVLMPPELRTAHQRNDRAVMEAYGMSIKETTESSCVAELMRLYQEMTKG